MKIVAASLAALALAGAVAGADLGLAGPTKALAALPDPAPQFTNPTLITNPWLPLSEHRRWVLEGTIDGKQIRTVKVLKKRTEPFQVGGQAVEAAIVRDSSYQNGALHEVALDYYAQADDGTVYYLGEDVDYYNKEGQVIGHHGAFRYGEDTDYLGTAMPAAPTVGQQYSIEDVPNLGSERNRVLSINSRVDVPAGRFKPALKVGGIVLPEKEHEVKWYGRGVGVLAEQAPDGIVELVGFK